ncbi:MAG: phage/plasmid primase, P4 family [Desulfovibrionaceae bacterium]|nr:phage/plasmid primase, P4 family [Desulfovibrionaceae bacterium]
MPKKNLVGGKDGQGAQGGKGGQGTRGGKAERKTRGGKPTKGPGATKDDQKAQGGSPSRAGQKDQAKPRGQASPVTDIGEIRRLAAARREQEQAEASAEDGPGKGSNGGEGGLTLAFVRDCLKANEVGDGMLYAEILRGKYLFSKLSKEWFVWRGHHWALDVMERSKVDVELVVEAYGQHMDALMSEYNFAATAITRRQNRLRSDRGKINCLTAAHTGLGQLAIRGDEMDNNPMLLAAANGVIDLESGELRAGRPKDLLSKASPVAWPVEGVSAKAETWERTLLEIYNGDEELVAFVQRVFGYAITGLSVEAILPVFWGQGRNGKSMIFDIIGAVLGPLAGPIASEMLLDQGRFGKSPSGPSPEIMALKGKRLVYGSETDDGRRISPSRAKWLSGGDTLVGRHPHSKYEENFMPTHTLFLLTNHKPGAPADDFAFWERVFLLPHLISFVTRPPRAENERPADRRRGQKLRAEMPGILAWLVNGCLEWQRLGLAPPARVLEATAEYRRAEDVIGDFIEECCIEGADFEVGATELYNAFEAWWEHNISKRPPKQRRFGQMLPKRFERFKSGRIKYHGLKLREDRD